jgi:hypothetical protein
MQRNSRPQDITWFLDLERVDQLNLSPPYQRKSAWTPKDRRSFLDTIFNNYPCPAIFLNKEIKDGKTVYNVVDGKQRLESILAFARGDIAIDKDFGDSRLAGKKFAKLDEDLKRAFWNYTLPVEMIDFEGTDTLREVFSRLNRNARKLEAQEIRHSQFDGWLMRFVEAEAEDQAWKDFKIASKANVRRMKDHQFISELLLTVIENGVHGFDQDWLDECYAKYDAPDDLDSQVSIDVDAIHQRFSECKEFLREMEKHNGSVSEHADRLAPFYSLWSWVALKRNSSHKSDVVADKYAAFMEDVECEKVGLPSKYNKWLKGASTDEEPRLNRLKLLEQVLA